LVEHPRLDAVVRSEIGVEHNLMPAHERDPVRQSERRMPEDSHGSGVFRKITSVVLCRQSIRERRNTKARCRALLVIAKVPDPYEASTIMQK
jgi:hypothetical protein